MIGGLKCWTKFSKKISTPFQKSFNIFSLFAMICILSVIYVIAYSKFKEGMDNAWKILPGQPVPANDSQKNNEHVHEPLRASRAENFIAPSSWKNVKESDNSELDKEFEKQWLRIQNDRVDWKQILAPCANNTVLNQTLPGWGKENETSLRTSYLDYVDVRPAGHFSRLFIKTKTNDGRNKTMGGDFWKMVIYSCASCCETILLKKVKTALRQGGNFRNGQGI